jgi:hypothetical protein
MTWVLFLPVYWRGDYAEKNMLHKYICNSETFRFLIQFWSWLLPDVWFLYRCPHAVMTDVCYEKPRILTEDRDSIHNMLPTHKIM